MMLMLLLSTDHLSLGISCIEFNGIHIPVIVHIDDGTAVTFNGLLHQLLVRVIAEMESVSRIVISTSFGLFSSCILHGLHFIQRILVIVGIFFPVEDLVLNLPPLPFSGQRHTLRQSIIKNVFRITIVPSQEVKSLSLGLSRLHGIGARCHKGRFYISTAGGVKGDPVTGFYLRIQCNIAALYGDRAISRLSQLCIIVPAGNALICSHRERHIRCNRCTGRTFLGSADCTFLIQEEDIIHLLKLSFIRVRCTGGSFDSTGSKEIAGCIFPTGEFVPIALRRSRCIDLVAGHDVLGTYRCAVSIKLVGIYLFLFGVLHRIGHNHVLKVHGIVAAVLHRIGCPGLQRQHGEHHDKCQECGERPFC